MKDNYRIGDKVFGSWEIIGEIGQGAYGRVFEIQRKDFGSIYKAALKVVSIPQTKSEIEALINEGMDHFSATSYFRSFVEEIVAEFALMSKLKGTANVVSYEDHEVIQHDDGIGWDVLIRMELLTSLNTFMREHKFTEADVIKLGIDISNALELCRKHNIIHRDIKLENIFVNQNGDYKLGDFGISRTAEKTMSGMSKTGTYAYMAPEVYKMEAYGFSVDTYSLGLVLYRLLNDGRAPFYPQVPNPIRYSDKELELKNRMGGESLPDPKNGSKALKDIILKACAYDPQKRFSSASDMKNALKSINQDNAKENMVYNAQAILALVSATNNDMEISDDQNISGITEKENLATEVEGTVKLFNASKENNVVESEQSLGYTPVITPNQKQKKNIEDLEEKSSHMDSDKKDIEKNEKKDVEKKIKWKVNAIGFINKINKNNAIKIGGSIGLIAIILLLIILNPFSKKTERVNIGDLSTKTLVSGEAVILDLSDDLDGGDIIWLSSDEMVVTVDENGCVTAVGRGTATVTVTCGDYEESCIFTVESDDEQEELSIELDETKVTLTEGDTYQLSVTISPENAEYENISWTSSDNTVVEVNDNGLVTAVKKGSAEITVKVDDLSLICSITVDETNDDELTQKYTVSVSTSNSSYGSVSGSGTYKEGDTCTIRATAKSGCIFVKWSDGNTSSSRAIDVSGNKSYQAIFYGPISDWSTSVPSGAQQVDSKTQYRYSTKQTTTSTASSLSGWIQYNTSTSWSDYGDWSSWSKTKVTSSDSRQVETKTVTDAAAYTMYKLYYYKYWNTDASAWYYTYYSGWPNSTYYSTNARASSCTPYESFSGHQAYTYDNWNLWWIESTWTVPAVTHTEYRYRDRTFITTYYYYKYGDWSSWSDNSVEANDNTKVETRILYTYRPK